MDQGLEGFLETVFGSLQLTSLGVGRVIVEPNYGASVNHDDASVLADELLRCVGKQNPAIEAAEFPHGLEIPISNEYPLLAKYVLKITLHGDLKIGPRVQVLPPGTWLKRPGEV